MNQSYKEGGKTSPKLYLVLFFAFSLFIFTIQGALAVDIDLDNGIISYWEFDVSSATQVDSVGSNDGTVDGATYTASGKINGGYDYDGSNDKIEVTDDATLDLGNNLTVSAWVRLETAVSYFTFLCKGNLGTGDINYAFQTEGAGDKFRFFVLDAGAHEHIDSTTSVVTNTWYHVVITVNGATAKLYIDGTLETTDTIFTTSIPTNAKALFFGARDDGTTQFWNGQIDEVGIWSRALTSDEVTALYNSRPVFSTGSVESVSPLNNTHTNNATLFFQVNVSDGDNATCNLFIDGVNNSVVAGVYNDTLVNFSSVLSDGSYSWLVNCSQVGSSAVTETRTLIVDTNAPVWTIRSLRTDNYSVFVTNSTYFFNDSVADTYLFAWNVSIRNSTGVILYTNQTINLTSVQENVSDVFNMSGLPNGYYSVTFYAEDDHTKELWDAQLSTIETKDDYGVTFLTPEKNEITIKSLDDAVYSDVVTAKLADSYTFDFSYVSPVSSARYLLKEEKGKIIYYRGDLYPFPSFVVDGGRGLSNWVDFKTDGAKSYSVKKVVEGWEVIVNFPVLVSDVKVKSLGGLNVANETYTFRIYDEPIVPTITCLYNPAPTRSEESVFSCGLVHVAGFSYNCFGLVVDADGSVLELLPKQTLISDYGVSGGVVPHPVGADNQSVKMFFSSNNLLANRSLDFLVKCVDNSSTPQVINFSAMVTPKHGDLNVGVSGVTSSIDKSSSVVMAFLGLALLLFAGLFFVKAVRG